MKMKPFKELKALFHRPWKGIPLIMWFGCLSGMFIGAAGGFCFGINRGLAVGMASGVLFGYVGIHIGFGLGCALYDPKRAILGAALATIPCWPFFLSPPQLDQEFWMTGILFILFAASCGATFAALVPLLISGIKKKQA